jgi:antitoxin component YwqK of YwqJK toxin-antitoxin module
MKKLISLIILVILIPDVSANGITFWPLKRSINRYDTQGRRQGKWVSYWDDDKKIPMNIERYKDGREIGRCRYYYMNGTKRLQFNVYRDGRMKVKYFSDTGKLTEKGWAVMIYDPREIRYSWNGPWKFYENGRLVKKSEYKMGEEVLE